MDKVVIIEDYHHMMRLGEYMNWMKLTQLLSKKTVNLRIPYCKSTFASKFLMLILDVYTGEK